MFSFPTASNVSGRALSASPGALLALVVAVGAGLRFALLGQNSLWFDEAWVVWVVQRPWREIFTVVRIDDAHPPLFYLLMNAWTVGAGTSEATLRFPSACFSAASVLLTYLVARRVLGEAQSLLSALLVSISPFEIMTGQDARMYALLGLLTLAATLALVRAVEAGRWHRWVFYVLLAALVAYTSYLGFLVLVAHGIWVASFDRPSLKPWLAAMLAAAMLYAPWMPSLWFQTIHGNGWPYSRAVLTYPPVGDILGLFAFGGSLFGMGTYFFPGSRDPLAQGIILLPFLGILWLGVGSLALDRRALALIGFPLAIPAVVMCAVYTKFTFYPRWFSFLFPFYAMVLACGIVGFADHVRRRRHTVLVILATGALLCTLPVLGRYYFDPGFRPYPWRAAAKMVTSLAQPHDLFMYVSSAAEISFSYYNRVPHPSLTLIPAEVIPGTGAPRPFTVDQARALARRYPRAWLITTPPFTPEMQQRLLVPLNGAFRVVGEHAFPGVWVHLLEAKPSGHP